MANDYQTSGSIALTDDKETSENCTERRDRPLRLAIVRTVGSPVNRSFYNSQELGLGAALLSHNFDVDVLVAGAEARIIETEVEHSGQRTLRLIEAPYRELPKIQQAIFPSFRKIIRQKPYDLVHVNESHQVESWLTARTAARKKIPVVMYQGMYQTLSGRMQAMYQSAFDRFCMPQLVRDVSLPLAKTRWAARHMTEKGFKDVEILPVGLDPTPFQQCESIDWRRRLNIPESHQVISYVGVLEPRRSPDLIVELATRLQDKPLAFVIAGTGVSEASTRAMIQERELSNLHMVGRIPQPQLPSLYRDSNLLLLPSSYEIYGMVVLEAMYFGLPVIASRTAGPDSIIDEGLNGWIVNGFDANTWIEAIQLALACPQKSSDVGQAAQRKICDELTWECIADRYSVTVRRLLTRQKT